MHIYNSRVNALMPHKGLDSQEVCTVLIKVCSESMPESMAGDPLRPSKCFFVIMDMPGNKEGIDWAGRICLFGKEPAGRPVTCKPVFGKDFQCMIRQDGISVRPVLAMPDMDPFIPALDILIPEAADFSNAETGRIHECGHCFDLDIRDRLNKGSGFLLGGHIRKIGIKSSHRQLCRIPGLMKDIQSEETDLGNGTVDRPVRKAP